MCKEKFGVLRPLLRICKHFQNITYAFFGILQELRRLIGLIWPLKSILFPIMDLTPNSAHVFPWRLYALLSLLSMPQVSREVQSSRCTVVPHPTSEPLVPRRSRNECAGSWSAHLRSPFWLAGRLASRCTCQRRPGIVLPPKWSSLSRSACTGTGGLVEAPLPGWRCCCCTSGSLPSSTWCRCSCLATRRSWRPWPPWLWPLVAWV